MKQKILASGAEANIIQKGDLIIKDRINKKYRHPVLDKKIIKQRTKAEAKLLDKAHKLINSPLPKNLEEINRASSKSPITKIEMPFIKGKKLSENLESLNWKELCKQIGNKIAILHDNNIIHGDLTTSNMILEEDTTFDDFSPNKINQLKQNQKEKLQINNKVTDEAEREEASNKKQGEVIFLDFGLGFTSERFEDKAVDLHLIKQALEAKHFTVHKEAEKIILDNYNSKDKIKILEQLKKVELRGRYKH